VIYATSATPWLAIIVALAILVPLVGIWQGTRTERAVSGGTQAEELRKLVESATAAQQRASDAQAQVAGEVSTLAARVADVEKLLREVR